MAQLEGRLSAARISLILSGDPLDPEQVSSLLQYEPTRLIRKGDLVSRLPALKAAENEWRHAVPLTDPLGHDSQLDSFLHELIGKKKLLSQLQEQGLRVTLRLYVQSDSVQMVYRLTPGTLSLLTELNMPLEVSSISWGEMA